MRQKCCDSSRFEGQPRLNWEMVGLLDTEGHVQQTQLRDFEGHTLRPSGFAEAFQRQSLA